MSSTYSPPLPAAVAADIGSTFGMARPRMSWQAILAGVVLVMAVEVLLGVLGAGVGFGMAHPGSAGNPDASAFATGAGLWSLGSMVLALIVGGWAAARLAGVVSRSDGMLHGLVIWAVALLLTVYLITSAAGGALSMLVGLASAAGSGMQAVAPQMTGTGTGEPDARARALLQPPQGGDLAAMSPEDAQKEVTRLLPEMAAGGERGGQARGRIIDIMAVQRKISHDDAARRLDEAQAQFDHARSAASDGAQAASQGALVAFAGLLVGAVAAAFGGAMARPRAVLIPNRFR